MQPLAKTILFVSTFLLLVLAVFPVAAQIGPVTDDVGIPTAGTAADVRSFAENLINVALSFMGLVALGFLLYGGFQYITSAGDEGKAETAKKTILYAIIGLIVIGLAAAVVNFFITGIGGGSSGGGSGGGGGGDSGGQGIP